MAIILPPVPNAIKSTQNWHIGSNLLAQTLHYFTVSGGPPSAANCAGIAAQIQAYFITDFKTNLHTSCSIGLNTVEDISSHSGHDGSGGAITAGTLTGSFLGASICVVVAHKVDRRYRGGHYRSYFPLGSSSSTLSNGSWASGITTAFQADFNDWVVNVKSISVGGIAISDYVGVSYFTGGAVRSSPQVDSITQSIVRARMGSQRRRLKTA